ncbi:MAG: sporulation protein YqfD [Clostridiales bacterium]|nr:sporulation protein YqfD [Clostridiales bacterium]
MLVNLIRYLAGYVKFEFSGGFSEGFLNDCYAAGLNIKNIKAKNGSVTAQADVRTYKRLHKFAHKNGGAVKITKRCGIIFLLSPLKGRYGFAAGLIFYIFFISFMGTFIWNITVTGNDRLSSATIIDYLEQNGLKVGARWADIDKESLEFAVMAEFSDVSWISINKIGSSAAVEINETVEKPAVEDSSQVTNVKALEDGVIVKVTALGGHAEVKAGDAVTAGDLLISGIYESETDGKNYFVHAHGSVIAQVGRKVSLYVSREQSRKNVLYTKEKKSLYLFSTVVPLGFGFDKGSYDIEIENKMLLINSYLLPVGIISESYSYYETNQVLLSDSELRALAESELEKYEQSKFADCKIIAKDAEYNLNEDGCNITAEYTIETDIASETQVNIVTESES